MAKQNRGIRDGTGPYKDSYKVRAGGIKAIGTRQEEGEECPIKVKKINIWGGK